MAEAVYEALRLVHEMIGNEEFREELQKAKEDYFRKVGAPLPGEPLEEIRLGSFVEWFAFDRPLLSSGRTPAAECLQRHPELDAPVKEALQGLQQAVHSIFLVKKRAPGKVNLKDMLSNKVYKEVKRAPVTLGKGDMADLRIFPLGEDWYATDALCVHPYSAKKHIKKKLKELRKNGGDPDELLLSLILLNTKYERAPRPVKDKVYAG
ncbi:MAG: hypothetical protein R6V10_16180 [bacterium]